MANRADADAILAGFVTCIPAAASPSCVQPAPASQARWRVVNLLWTGNAMAADTDLLDVGLRFEFEGGARAWHWDVVHPGAAFVETDLFDGTLIATMTRLSLTATLARTTFDPVFRGDSFLTFDAKDASVSASQSSFPPPLDLLVDGEFARPTPEPASLALIASGAIGLALRHRRRARRLPRG